jgi:methyltransferase
MIWYFLLLVLFGVRKIIDQIRSHRNFDALIQRGLVPNSDPAAPLLVFTHVLFFILTPLEVLALRREFIPALGIPMILILFAAMGLRYWSRSSLGAYWTSRVAVPSDMRPVVRGPYRLIRHPNYLAMSIELLAMDLIYSAWLTAVVVGILNAWSIVLRMKAEERALFQVPGYQEAMQNKARLIPGVY